MKKLTFLFLLATTNFITAQETFPWGKHVVTDWPYLKSQPEDKVYSMGPDWISDSVEVFYDTATQLFHSVFKFTKKGITVWASERTGSTNFTPASTEPFLKKSAIGYIVETIKNKKRMRLITLPDPKPQTRLGIFLLKNCLNGSFLIKALAQDPRQVLARDRVLVLDLGLDLGLHLGQDQNSE